MLVLTAGCVRVGVLYPGAREVAVNELQAGRMSRQPGLGNVEVSTQGLKGPLAGRLYSTRSGSFLGVG